jgi:hypothetical protein
MAIDHCSTTHKMFFQGQKNSTVGVSQAREENFKISSMQFEYAH